MSTPESKPAVVMPRWLVWAGLVVAVGAVAGGYFVGPRGIDPVLTPGPVGAAASLGATAGVGGAGGGGSNGPAVAPGAASTGAPSTGATSTGATPAAGGAAAGPGPVGAGPVAPSFDVVRVSPSGSTVVAGRAAPGSDVVLFDGTKEVARARADWRGEFVALPPEPLAAGGRTLTLASRSEGVEARSDGAVVVVVPEAPRATPAPVATSTSNPVTAPVAPAGAAATPAAPFTPVPGSAGSEEVRAPAAAEAKVGEPAKAPVVAVLVPSAGPARVLQEAPHAVGAVTLDVVDYDDKGAIRFSGSAPAAAAVRLYVDNGPVGDARADGSGRWTLTPEGVVTPGVHRVRADLVDGAGQVSARVEMPFERSAVAAAELAGGRVVVQPGQNLWRLARAAYGHGVRYTVIYLANREQIRDPRLIYPGQAFAIPVGP